jgi:superfamily II DNA or RNA helicase
MRTATIRNNKIELKFYSKDSVEFFDVLEKVKSIEGRRFDSATKTWSAPLSLDTVDALTALDFSIDPKITAQLQDQHEKKQEIKKAVQSIVFSDSHLFDFQVPHAKQIIESLLTDNAALDASDTGTGKTFVALAVASYLKLKPIVVTPKTVIPSWKKAAKYFGIDCFCLNYKQYRTGKVVDLLTKKTTEDGKDIYKWHTDESHIIIFDEAHRCKNDKTQNSKMMRAAKKCPSKVMALSATIADNPLHLYSLGLLLGLFDDFPSFWSWAYKRGVHKGWFGVEFHASEENLKKIHADLFPAHGSRIRIRDLGDRFPDNMIICDPYNMNSNAKKIQHVYDSMHAELSRLNETKEKDKGACILTEILRARQEIELLKVPTIVEMAEDLIEEGSSVAVFVNFKETIAALSDKLKTKCIIDGAVTGEDREKNIEAFQSDVSRIILCNIKAGGVGISLHDLNGTYPRVSLISPTNSAIDLVQSLGRIHRAGAKSKAIQKLIFCADTIEEEIAEKVSGKIDNIKLINDGDLDNSLYEKNKKN